MISLNLKLRNRLRWAYVLTDLVSTSVAVLLFNVFRWTQLTAEVPLSLYLQDAKVLLVQVGFTGLMMLIYWLSGYYNRVEQRSRSNDALQTATAAIIGSFSIFFLAVVNDLAWRRRVAFGSLFVAAGVLFVCVFIGRYLITRLIVRNIHRRHNPNAAVMLGTDAAAASLAYRINTLRKGMEMTVTTFVRINPDDPVDPRCEDYEVISRSEFHRLCRERAVNSMIITPGVMNNGEYLADLMRLAHELNGALFISPDVNTIGMASRRSFNIVGEPLVCISSPNVPESTVNIKRAIDVMASLAAMVLLAPAFAVVAAAVKLDSPGPVFFRQERIGRGGRPFKIWKFRSMVRDAEADGRARVTVDGDPRITRVGRFLRKYRIDEFPQFLNVLRGEMSLVGPRPERREFAEQIAARVPLYPLLYCVRPGITSWGQVRYGYASNVDQMVERLRYDLIYLENISVSTDLKILLHTVNTVLSGKGK